LSWILAFAGFAALVVLHEAGHFAAAKAVGMKVEKFYLFFPPKLAAVRRGETEYGVGAIPLGGFVKISGMNPDEPLPADEAHRGYYAQPVWKRIVVIAAGPFVNLVIAFAILFFLAFDVADPDVGLVSQIEPGSPAARILEPGDRIVAVDGEGGTVAELRERIAGHGCPGEPEPGCVASEPVELTVVRDGREVTVAARPRFDEEAGRPVLGFQYRQPPLDPSATQAAAFSAETMWTVTERTLGVIFRIFEAEQREQISSVVTRQAIEFSTERALFLLAIISLSLAIINLFPFLPLDGGHIFWSVVEKVRGRPVPFRVMERAGVVGFVLVLMLFFVGLSNDIDRLTGEGFGLR
jgi:regulator of sigma E protease